MTKDSKLVADYSTETVAAADGLSLSCRRWDPVTDAVATVVIVHGLGEHSGRYVHVGRYFAEAGFRTIALDLRGHGRSAGPPVFVQSYAELASDVDCVVRHFRGNPAFVFGHSLGGQLVLWTAQHFPLEVQGLIISAPWLGLTRPPPWWQVFAVQRLNGLVPGLRFSTGIHPERLSRDQAHLDSLEDLDLSHRFVTIRTYLESAKAANEIMRAPVIEYPVLFALGEADEITSSKVAEEYFIRLQAPAKSLKIYPGLRHELHNETERDQVLADYVAWMKSVIQTGSPEQEEAPSRS